VIRGYDDHDDIERWLIRAFIVHNEYIGCCRIPTGQGVGIICECRYHLLMGNEAEGRDGKLWAVEYGLAHST